MASEAQTHPGTRSTSVSSPDPMSSIVGDASFPRRISTRAPPDDGVPAGSRRAAARAALSARRSRALVKSSLSPSPVIEPSPSRRTTTNDRSSVAKHCGSVGPTGNSNPSVT